MLFESNLFLWIVILTVAVLVIGIFDDSDPPDISCWKD